MGLNFKEKDDEYSENNVYFLGVYSFL